MALTGDSLVLTDRGLVRINRLVSGWTKMGVGSRTPLVVGVSQKQKVIKTVNFCYGGQQKTIKIETLGGRFLEGTEGQKIQLWDNGKLVWQKLSDIKLRELMVVPTGAGLWGTQKFTGQFQTMASFSQDAFLSFLRTRFRGGLLKIGLELRLRAGSIEAAQFMQMQMANLGLLATTLEARSSCCRKSFVSLKGEDAHKLIDFVQKSDRRLFNQVDFVSKSDTVKHIHRGTGTVFGIEVTGDGSFVVNGWVCSSDRNTSK
jgi:hypothetical protein